VIRNGQNGEFAQCANSAELIDAFSGTFGEMTKDLGLGRQFYFCFTEFHHRYRIHGAQYLEDVGEIKRSLLPLKKWKEMKMNSRL
jgi:hypothetical protein